MPDTKNPGPLLTSYVLGDVNVLPTEWRAKMGFRQEDQQVPLSTLPPEPSMAPIITGITIESQLIQTRTDERKRTTITTNPAPPNGGQPPPGGGPPDSWMMVSEERIPNGQVATRTRAFVPEGSHLVLTDDMLTAEQRNLGVALDQIVLTAPIPGPEIVDTKWDEISSLVSTIKRRKLVSAIVDNETIVGGVWRQTSREGETATVASEVVTSRILPSSTIVSTDFDQESVKITTKKTKKEAALIVDGETIVGGLWKKIYHHGETGLVAVEIEESRTLPGPTLASTRIDNDSTLINIAKTKRESAGIVSGESIVAGVWQRRFKDGETQLIAMETVENRTLPGATIESTEFDPDSVLVTTKQTRKDKTTIVDGETIVGGLWKKIFHKGESGLVSMEVEESRTLPGPVLASTRLDPDSTLVNITKTKRESNTITSGESIVGGVWQKRYKDGQTQLIALETVELRTLPGATVISTRFDPDSVMVTIAKTIRDRTTFTDGESINAGVWTKTYREGESGLVATEVRESRTIPGPVVESYRIDDDGATVTIRKTRKLLANITEGDVATATLWTKVYADGETLLVATEIVESRVLGAAANIVKSSRIEQDGNVTTITKQLKKEDLITSDETVSGNTWTKIYKEAVTGAVAKEVIEVRLIGTQAGVLPSATVNQDEVLVQTNKILRAVGAVGLTDPGSVIIGTNIWTTERKEVSDVVFQEVVSGRAILDKPMFGVSIPNPLPEQFRTLAATTEESHIVAGTATLPALGTNMEVTEQQIDRLLKRVTTKTLAGTVLPIEHFGQELTFDYGGGILTTSKKIDVAGDPSLDIPPTDLTNQRVTKGKLERFGPYGIRERAFNSVAAWPLLIGGTVDPETHAVMRFTQQVVDGGTEPSVGPNFSSEIKPLDAARSLKIVTQPNVTAMNNYIVAFPGMTSVDIPPELWAVYAQASSSKADGAYSEQGSYTIFNNGNGSMSLNGNCTGSAAAMYDVIPYIKFAGGQNVRCQRYLFFVASVNFGYAYVLGRLNQLIAPLSDPPVIALAWPRFKPQNVQITCMGYKVAGSSKAVQQFSDSFVSDYLGAPKKSGYSRSFGSGQSKDIEVVMKSVTIPPTIHGALSVIRRGVKSVNFSAYSWVKLGTGSPTNLNVIGNATADFWPTTIPATVGRTTIPTTGSYLHKIRVEPWKHGYFKCECEVVEAGQW